MLQVGGVQDAADPAEPAWEVVTVQLFRRRIPWRALRTARPAQKKPKSAAVWGRCSLAHPRQWLYDLDVLYCHKAGGVAACEPFTPS